MYLRPSKSLIATRLSVWAIIITAILKFVMTIPCLVTKLNMCNSFNSNMVFAAVYGGQLTNGLNPKQKFVCLLVIIKQSRTLCKYLVARWHFIVFTTINRKNSWRRISSYFAWRLTRLCCKQGPLSIENLIE